MRNGIRHLAGASLILASLTVTTERLGAQEYAECNDAVGVADEHSPCFRPVGPCKGKACYGHRPYTENSQPDVFYNLYVPNNLGAAAAAYPAPYPTPNLIGHTYYTYQPLMPAEMLYHHHRTYHQYYNGGMGMNRTSVHWGGTPVRTALKGVGKFFTLPH